MGVTSKGQRRGTEAIERCPFLHAVCEIEGQEMAMRLAENPGGGVSSTRCPGNGKSPILLEEQNNGVHAVFQLFHGSNGVFPLREFPLKSEKAVKESEMAIGSDSLCGSSSLTHASLGCTFMGKQERTLAETDNMNFESVIKKRGEGWSSRSKNYRSEETGQEGNLSFSMVGSGNAVNRGHVVEETERNVRVHALKQCTDGHDIYRGCKDNTMSQTLPTASISLFGMGFFGSRNFPFWQKSQRKRARKRQPTGDGNSQSKPQRHGGQNRGNSRQNRRLGQPSGPTHRDPTRSVHPSSTKLGSSGLRVSSKSSSPPTRLSSNNLLKSSTSMHVQVPRDRFKDKNASSTRDHQGKSSAGHQGKGSQGNAPNDRGPKSNNVIRENGEGGRCPMRKFIEPLGTALPLALGSASGVRLHCPRAVVAMRAAIAKLQVVRDLRPKGMHTKSLAMIGTAVVANIPCGMWRKNTTKFSPAWFLAVHATIPFVAMLRKAVLMPPWAILLTVGGAIGGQHVGEKLMHQLESKNGAKLGFVLRDIQKFRISCP